MNMLKKICPVVFGALLVACGDSGSSNSANDVNLSSSSERQVSSSSVASSTVSCVFEGEVGDSEWTIKQKQPSENFCKTVLGVSSNTEDMEFRCEGEWLVTVYRNEALGSDESSRQTLYEQLKSSCR